MTNKTLALSSIQSYLAYEYESNEEKANEMREREYRTHQFPHTVMLELAYPELDYATRWCWQQFGPMDGDCLQKYSDYKVCHTEGEHNHTGKWTSHWFVKTNYDFGYNEFYFAEETDRESFLAQVPEINWRENFPRSISD